METIRTVEITVMIDTNKGTYKETFKDIDDAINYLNERLERINNSNGYPP